MHKSGANKVKQGATISDNGIQVIHFALAKYGIENFSFIILEEVNTQQKANDRETHWVSYYGSFKCGYNCTFGGSNAPKTEEWKQKVKATRIANGSYAHSEETKNRMSEAWLNHHSPESIQKGSDARLGQKQPQSVIKNRVDVIAAKYGSKICNADNCFREDGFKVNGVRYCDLHAQRLRNTGILALRPRIAPNKGKEHSQKTKNKISKSKKGKMVGKDNSFYGKKHSSKTIEYLREINLNKEPPNKKHFSEEQVNRIITDTRSLRKISKDFNVSTTVICRIKKASCLK